MNQFITEQISDTHTRIHWGSRTIILVGTAHVSAESLSEVKKAIAEEKPDHVCIEIDEGRLRNLEDGRRWSGTDMRKVLKKKQGFMMLANFALSAFQKKAGIDSGISPGEEMKAAATAAREAGIPFSCVDRSIQVTLSRAWRLSSFWSKMKLISALTASVLSKESVSSEEIEQLKKTDAMQGMMRELAEYLPAIKTVLIDERDHFLASGIYRTQGEKTLAVVGAAHVPGIVSLLREFLEQGRDADTTDIESIPPRPWWGKAAPWIIPAIILGLFTMGIIRSGFQQGLEMGYIWVLANGTLSALGAILALAHPVTIIVSFLGAPITSLNPTIGVGMVAGLLEYLLRPPRVVDLEKINTDILSLRGWYRNRVSRILMVFLFSSVGSSVGSFVALPWITRIAGS